MKWIRERDALIAQTLAFVQSVAGRKEEVREAEGQSAATTPPPEPAPLVAVKYALKTTPQPLNAGAEPIPAQPIQPSRSKVSCEVEAEFRDRIASFRSHQERFRREREEYFTATLAKVRTALREAPPLRSGQ